MKRNIKYWRDMRDGVDYVYTPAKSDGAVVDIWMLTYNHEPYIRHAIESVLMQETRYPYRLLIGDDHSTDRTAEIIREYQERYPDRIATILWNYNTGLTGLGCNGITLFRYCKAPYIATLEGDDYWTSPHKLEAGISFLEDHPEYVGWAHNFITVDENERHLVWWANVCEAYVYTLRTAMERRLLSQTAAVINRNYMLSWPEQTWDDLYRCRMYGDWIRAACLAALGEVYCAREIMSAYRLTFRGSSWQARTKDKNLALDWYVKWKDLAEFIHRAYDIDFDIERFGEEFYQESRELLLREFSLENLKIFLKLFVLAGPRKKRPARIA